jgi:hypothetical protein
MRMFMFSDAKYYNYLTQTAPEGVSKVNFTEESTTECEMNRGVLDDLK